MEKERVVKIVSYFGDDLEVVGNIFDNPEMNKK